MTSHDCGSDSNSDALIIGKISEIILLATFLHQ